MVEIKSIKKVPFKGTVYNLAVEKDETYIAEGTVVHNCRSRLTPIFVSDLEDKGSYFYNAFNRFDEFGQGISEPGAQKPAKGFGG